MFNLQNLRRVDVEPEPEPEPEPSVAELSDPGLSKAPPPSYQAASNFPTQDTKSDLPPPYPGGPGPAYPPPTAPPPTAPPPTAPPNNYPLPWVNPAYPPPTGPSELPYPTDNTPYPT